MVNLEAELYFKMNSTEPSSDILNSNKSNSCSQVQTSGHNQNTAAD